MKINTLYLVLTVVVAGANARPLNFIHIIVDDMGYSDIGCMGGSVDAPNLDQLAESGMLDYRDVPLQKKRR